MIVKILKNKGGGSAKATMNYLLGKNRDRDGAKILQGDPDLTERLADNCKFKNRYTVGVLSFEEQNIPEKHKREIMDSFEKSLLAGLEHDQYDITWIEHTDKGRLELNFVIPNVELTTGKRLQPYYDKADRPLVENWKQVINHEYGLTDPHDPSKAKVLQIDQHNLPKSIREIQEKIGMVVCQQIEQGNINNRSDVIAMLEGAGFEIARLTPKNISIKNPDGGRNIRLKGVIYEDRQLSQELGAEHSQASRDFRTTATERYRTALTKLQGLTDSKQARNREIFNRNSPNTAKNVRGCVNSGYGVRNFVSTVSVPSRAELVAIRQATRQESRDSEYKRSQSPNPFKLQGSSKNEHFRGRQLGLHHNERGDSRDIQKSERGYSAEDKEIGAFYEQRLLEPLQRAYNRFAKSVRQDTERKREAKETEREILDRLRGLEAEQSEITENRRNLYTATVELAETSEPIATKANRELDRASENIRQREQQAISREQQLNHREQQANEISRGATEPQRVRVAEVSEDRSNSYTPRFGR